ncbi:hypothetical protein POTOM_008205 [Populus tomentosa]|uniref:Uncharacterized protein n=1 Tax=Populus tomentosa TaxID=118781 RepID=A0A8X8AE22_POPTO|nr:hypothetical protein POTOM_008205 [Populus tomentosa]
MNVSADAGGVAARRSGAADGESGVTTVDDVRCRAPNTGEKDHKPACSTKLTGAQRKRKQECQRNFYARNKQKSKDQDEEVEALRNECAYYQGQADAYKKGIQEELAKVVNSVGEVVNKQTAQIDKLCEPFIKEKHSAGTRGSTSSSTEVLEGAPNELAFNILMERYIASETHHAREKVATEARHAKEMAAIIAHHAQEMANTEARHAQEMAAVRTEYGLDVEFVIEFECYCLWRPLLHSNSDTSSAGSRNSSEIARSMNPLHSLTLENEILQAPAGALPGIEYGDLFVNYDSFPAVP